MALSVNFRSQMLWDNIRKADLTAVVTLLENGTINLEERDESGQTFLMTACQQGEISLVRELLEAGIDPNAIDNDSWSALLYAAKDGHLEICIELLERGAEVDHRDLCKWTALMWASYKGRSEVVQELLDREADPNVKAEHNMSCLIWAAGRGHTEVTKALLDKGAKVNSTDEYGTSPLVWACRKGHLEIVQELLNNGAHVDATGMDSLSALLVATKGGYTEVVQALLEHEPNVNALDKDGFTALTIAAREGYEDIVQELLAKDAYVNIADRAGDTILIHAVKGGYTSIVRALLNRYADVDVEGTERRTAIYWAVEKGHAPIVQQLIDNDADLEICTKDGDTPLMRAVRNRHELIVRQLLDKGAKVAVYDKKGDTALHISLRARSKRITELLLRNPRNSRLLYRPNKSGETPYSIDAYHQKGILTQIHGHRQLNASDGENLLGYEIYSSSLADILSEPSLNTPITVGLYAKWGSGKSFLIGKLKSEMKSFTKANDDNQLTFTWSLFILLLIANSIIGSVLALAVNKFWQVGLGVGLGLFLFEYGFLGLIWVCSTRYNVRFAQRVSQSIGKRLQIITLLLQLLFCNPVTRSSSEKEVPLVKFLFSENTKLTSVGGEKALGAMIAGLSESVEKEFGLVSSRLFGVVKQVSDKNYIGRFKTLCCIPLFIIVVFLLLCFLVGIALLVIFKIENEDEDQENKVANVLMITFAGIVGLSLLSNIHNIGKAVIALIVPQKSRVMKAADNVHRLKLDGFMQVLKKEVSLMNNLVMSVDRFTKNTTRLVVVVDGLDSCEQDKVLQVLDIIHALFNEENSSFVVILAVDPQIIIKGIDQNLKSVFQDTNVNGFDYLRNIVHLPFYLQSQGIQVKKQGLTKSVSTYDVNHDSPTHNHKAYRHQESAVSQISGFSVIDPGNKKGRGKSRTPQDSLVQIAQSNFDISHTLTKNDYFSDINPKSMRRLMNIVAVTGRLLRAYNIDFNWYRLAAWVNLVEQWPYRLSWIILYFEEHDDLNDDVTMKFIYDKIEGQMPVSSDIEPLLEIDRNVRKLQAFLSSKSNTSHMLNISDLKKFLPCTINLDPYLRKLIRNLQSQMQSEMPMGMYNTPPPPPPSNGSDNLRSTLTRAAMKTPMGPVYPPPMMPYGPMMYPGIMGMPPQYMGGVGGWVQPPVGVNDAKKSASPAQYITGYSSEKLINMSTVEVSGMLERISGLNSKQLPLYQQAVLDNNLNGIVLSQCDLDDLGKCLEMKFGDWQLFRSAIQALRDAEDCPSTDPSADEINSATQMNSSRRKPSEQSVRSIHFSNSDSGGSVKVSESDSGTKLPTKPRSAIKRQGSVDTQRESQPNFDAIKEEDEGSKSSSSSLKKKGMPRNDSMVAQVMYESGILHDFVHNFTEDLSEENELSDEDDEDGGSSDNASKDLIDMNSNAGSISSALSHSEVVKTPVQFSLSLDSNRSRDDNQPNIHESETEPLIKSPSRNTQSIFSSPTPILKLPVLKTTDMLGGGRKTVTKSEPDLTNVQQSEVTVHQELLPLIPVTKATSTASTGFSSLHDHGPMATMSTESIEMVAIVDETSQNYANSNKSMSIEDSIQKYTKQSLSPDRETSPTGADGKFGGTSRSTGSGNFGGASQSGVPGKFGGSSPGDVIQVKGSKNDSKTPESFV